MIYNIVLTHDCNKNCEYCRNQEADVPFPRKIAYDYSVLKKFITKDPHPMIAFYGGEPLLGLGMMERIMETIPVEKWVIQTNGHFLHTLPDKYLLRFTTLLVSMDGPLETTDHYRGKGTHDIVLNNVRLIRQKGYKNELTARMCVSDHSDIYRDVSYLLNLKDDKGNQLFDGVHWQNNMMFCDREEWADLDGWLQNSYYPGLTRLINEWVNRMELEGVVRLIYPFIGVMRTILTGEKAKLHCGCGHANHNICTDGKITACPVSSDFYEIFQIGSIYDSEPTQLIDSMKPEEPCPSCEIFSICGGRCLYANKLKPWGKDGYRKVCETVFYLVRTLQAKLPIIHSLIDSGKLKLSQFDYFQYNGAEIIP